MAMQALRPISAIQLGGWTSNYEHQSPGVGSCGCFIMLRPAMRFHGPQALSRAKAKCLEGFGAPCAMPLSLAPCCTEWQPQACEIVMELSLHRQDSIEVKWGGFCEGNYSTKSKCT